MFDLLLICFDTGGNFIYLSFVQEVTYWQYCLICVIIFVWQITILLITNLSIVKLPEEYHIQQMPDYFFFYFRYYDLHVQCLPNNLNLVCTS